jgi:hypothetical protein
MMITDIMKKRLFFIMMPGFIVFIRLSQPYIVANMSSRKFTRESCTKHR